GRTAGSRRRADKCAQRPPRSPRRRRRTVLSQACSSDSGRSVVSERSEYDANEGSLQATRITRKRLARQPRQNEGARGVRAADRALAHETEEVAALIGSAIGEQHRHAVVHAEDPDEAAAHIEIEE